MKINSINIAAFGKFKDFHLDLNDGMTVIFGENENGKTTIMAFIRMMFYGNTGKSSDLDKNPRIKYRPWNSDFMAGSVTFTHGGSNYRLEREFKKSNSTDKITLIDLDTGETRSLSGSDDIGAKFFGLTDAAFERSVFVGELGAPSKNESADGEINSKLSNIAVTGDEDVSFEKISARILKAKEALMSKGGKKGKYDKALIELEELERKIDQAVEGEKQLKLLEEKAKSKETSVKKCTEESARLFELLKNADKIRKRRRLEKYIEISLAAKDADNALSLNGGGFADATFLAEIRAKKDACEKTSGKILDLEADVKDGANRVLELSALTESADNFASETNEILETKLNEIDRLIEENKEKSAVLNQELDNKTPLQKPRLLLVVLGGLLIAASAVPFVLTMNVLGLVLLVPGVVLAVLGFVLKKSVMPDNSQINKEVLDLSSRLSSLLDEKQSVLNEIKTAKEENGEKTLKLAANKALLEEKKAEIAGKQSELDSLKKFYKEQTLALFQFCSALKPVFNIEDTDSLIAELSVLLDRKEKFAHNINLLGEGVNCSSLDEAREKLQAYSSLNTDINEEELDLAKEKFKTQSDILSLEKTELAKINAEIKTLTETTESAAVLCRKRDLLKVKIAEYKKFCDTCGLALDTLTDAFKELRRNYSGVLNSSAAQIFSRLTAGKYDSVNISKNFEIGVDTKEAFGLKESGYLSSGTADQAYLALRLAVAELITENSGSLPIFMDDSLTQYDDTRAKLALEFLKEYSKDRQLLLFTCHSYFKDVANDLSIKTFEL